MWTSIDAPDLNVYSLISSPHFIVEVFVSFGLLKNTVITSLGKGSKKVGYSILEGREHRCMVQMSVRRSRPYFAQNGIQYQKKQEKIVEENCPNI